MKAKICITLLFLFVVGIYAQDQAPAAISPASEVGIAKVGTSCPTFSWTAVDSAVAYRVEVFPAGENHPLTYELIAGQANPVLVKEIQGAATSWTPSSDESLRNDGVYVWFIQALDEFGTGRWSQGRMFKIEARSGFAAIEEAVSDTLEKHGVEKDIIEDVIGNMNEAQDAIPAGSANPIPISVQGHESDSNTWYGLYAGASLIDPRDNSLFGSWAGSNLDTGFSNTFIGGQAGRDLTEGNGNVFIGKNAGLFSISADFNVFIGHGSGNDNISGDGNVFVGTSTGHNNLGDDNTFIGFAAGVNNSTGQNNVFIGSSAGWSSTTGSNNTFIGDESGISNTTGYANAFFGLKSGRSNTTGFSNTFVGRFAGHDNTEGNYNVFLGRGAGSGNITGTNNTYIGNRTGYTNTSGDNNVFVGRFAGYNETGSNRLYIDNSDTSKPLIWGNFNTDTVAFFGTVGVGTKTPAYPMEMKKTGTNASIVLDRTDGATNYINATDTSGNFGTVSNHVLRLVVNSLWQMRIHTDGSLDMRNGASCTAGGVWTNASSRELKENIQGLTTDEAVDTLQALDPVKYSYKADKEDSHVGFIAEDVPELVASKDRKGMSPMDVVAVLTKVLQEQQDINEELQSTVEKLSNQIAELKKSIKY